MSKRPDGRPNIVCKSIFSDVEQRLPRHQRRARCQRAGDDAVARPPVVDAQRAQPHHPRHRRQEEDVVLEREDEEEVDPRRHPRERQERAGEDGARQAARAVTDDRRRDAEEDGGAEAEAVDERAAEEADDPDAGPVHVLDGEVRVPGRPGGPRLVAGAHLAQVRTIVPVDELHEMRGAHDPGEEKARAEQCDGKASFQAGGIRARHRAPI
jgi:hypothetical protein